MATRTTGYECEFLENPPRVLQYLCPICLLVLREPHQATCCGENFCKECIHRVKAANAACPTCREKDFCLFHDKGLQRILYNFRVYCTYKSKGYEGCEWTGELGELDNHLNSDPPADKALQGCPYTLIKCPSRCAECKEGIYYRKAHAGGMPKYVKAHAGDDEEDEKAHAGGMPEYVKAHAGDDEKAHAGGDEEAHAGDMPKYYGKVKFMISRHRLRSVQTEFACLFGQRMTKLESKVDPRMVASKPQPFVQPQQPVTGTYKPVGAEFTMTKFDEYKSDNDTWYSPHFYTHPNGYKMYLHVDANGNASGRGTHLSVFVCLMRGEFDDQLEWPFQGNITIKVANQEEDRDHVIQIVRSRNAGGRCERVMTTERINNGWGIGQFLSHAELQPKYLKNDCIKFYIKKIDLY